MSYPGTYKYQEQNQKAWKPKSSNFTQKQNIRPKPKVIVKAPQLILYSSTRSNINKELIMFYW